MLLFTNISIAIVLYVGGLVGESEEFLRQKEQYEAVPGHGLPDHKVRDKDEDQRQDAG